MIIHSTILPINTYFRHVHPVYDKYGVYYCVVKNVEQSYGIVLLLKVLSIHYFPAFIHDWNFKFYPKYFFEVKVFVHFMFRILNYIIFLFVCWNDKALKSSIFLFVIFQHGN